MKKIIALLLASVMCLSLVACGGSGSAKKEIVGEWKHGSWIMSFNDDGTGFDPDGGKLTWIYDNKEDKYVVTFWTYDMEFDVSIKTDDDGNEYITIKGQKYYLYDKSNTSDTSENEETTDKEPLADDNNKLEKKYQRVVKWAENPSQSLADDNGKGMSYNETLKYIYTLLKELGDYKDSSTYLSRFTVVADTLSYITKTQTDSFDQVIEKEHERYDYDNNGECFRLSETFELISVLGAISAGNSVNCKYNDNGKLIGASFITNFVSEENRIICKLQIEYDAKENVEKANFQMADGTAWTNTFVYDDENRLLQANIDKVYDGSWTNGRATEGYVDKYYYDDQGYLIKKSKEGTSWDDCVEEYAYDTDGRLLQMNRYGYDWTGEILNTTESYKETYAYDEQGRVLSVEVTENNQIFTLVYHYDDIYRYNKDK